MKAAIILISTAGLKTASLLNREFGYDIYSLHREEGTQHIPSVDVFLSAHFADFNALIFIGAMGICVRSIAPYIKDKHTDPAVVCVDVARHNVVSVLSGHVGGANELTTEIAHALGGHAVITTQTDNTGQWPLDTLGRRFGWHTEPQDMNRQIFLFTQGQPTALLLEVRDKGTEWMEANLPEHVKVFYDAAAIAPSAFRLLIIVGPQKPTGISIPTVHYVPRCLHLGVGLAHQAQPVDKVIAEMFDCLKQEGIPAEAVEDFNTIVDKKDEPVVAQLQQQGYTVNFFTADELKGINVPNPSETVQKYMDTPSVSEAAALKAAASATLLVQKQKGTNWTLAAAVDYTFQRHGHVEIVGAGPGDPDLVSVRGRKMLERADLILYAGSLVPRELTLCAKDGATVRSSASMALEEQCSLMKEFYDRGQFIVRLHTGDPCIFGAIEEQMAFFDKEGMDYHITPGISSFLAAAAELRSQFTIPGKVQTIILTRGEGRTPMPEREKLHLLARSRSTMCIFLSAAIADDVQRELLQEYPEDTPVAACYHLTWKDQHIYRGKLKDLAKIVRDNNLTLTTMLVVGDAIDNRKGLSELYSKSFTHLFRKAEK